MKNKYFSIKCEYEGIQFDSHTERDFYIYLRARNLAPKEEIKLQVEFTLLDKFELLGKKYRPIRYIADFVIRDEIIIDIKGFRTLPVFDLKKKLMAYYHQKEVLVVVRTPKYFQEAFEGIEFELLENVKKIRRWRKEKKDMREIKFKKTLKNLLFEKK